MSYTSLDFGAFADDDDDDDETEELMFERDVVALESSADSVGTAELEVRERLQDIELQEGLSETESGPMRVVDMTREDLAFVMEAIHVEAVIMPYTDEIQQAVARRQEQRDFQDERLHTDFHHHNLDEATEHDHHTLTADRMFITDASDEELFERAEPDFTPNFDADDVIDADTLGTPHTPEALYDDSWSAHLLRDAEGYYEVDEYPIESEIPPHQEAYFEAMGQAISSNISEPPPVHTALDFYDFHMQHDHYGPDVPIDMNDLDYTIDRRLELYYRIAPDHSRAQFYFLLEYPNLFPILQFIEERDTDGLLEFIWRYDNEDAQDNFRASICLEVLRLLGIGENEPIDEEEQFASEEIAIEWGGALVRMAWAYNGDRSLYQKDNQQ